MDRERCGRCRGAGTINGPTAKELLPELFAKGGMPKEIVGRLVAEALSR